MDLPVFRHLVKDRLVYWNQNRWAIGAKSNKELGETPILQSKVSNIKAQAWEATWDEAVLSCGRETGMKIFGTNSFKEFNKECEPLVVRGTSEVPLASEGIYFIVKNRTNETRAIYKNVYYETYIKWSEPKQQENILTCFLKQMYLFQASLLKATL